MSAGARLLSVAERLVEACPAELGSEIAVTGSVGAGLADELSDLELLLLVNAPPEPSRVTAWLESVGATDVLAGQDSSGTWAWCLVDGVEVEPYWGSLEETRREVDAVAAGESVEHGALAFAHVVTHSVVLRSHGAFRDFEARLAGYPEELPRRLVETAAAVWELPSARLGAAARGDRLPVQWFLQQDAGRVLRVVFALNRRWELPRWKWLAAFAAELDPAPDRLAQRVVEPLVARDAVGAVRAMVELVRDTLELVPSDFGVAAARRATERRLAALEQLA
jgi:hypothetical protein